MERETDYIVEILEPKKAVAYEMKLNSIETEMQILKYLRRPDLNLRNRIEEYSANFLHFEIEV